MAVLNQTIAVVDKSGKVVSTSKHLFGVFKEAKTAYRERKAEIQAEKQLRIAEKETIKALESYTIDDSRSVGSSRRPRSSGRRHRSERNHHHPQYHDGQPFYQLDSQPTHSRHKSSRAPEQEMVRRHTSHDVAFKNPTARPVTSRSMSVPQVDMDLAYGEYHAPTLAEKQLQQSKQQPQEQELDGLVAKVTGLLEEADCAQHTATATISHLQKNPDAMAAVALTLAEISNVAAKLAPAALAALKSSAPTIFALLASPQFLIAAGVGIGVTIVMFGGYKIIKHIQQPANAQENRPTEYPMQQPMERGGQNVEEMIELASDCSNVESWRRGVADAEADSYGTSVDGEFITRTAANMSGMFVNDRVGDLRSSKSVKSRKTRDRDRDDVSKASSRTSRTSRSSRTEKTEKTSKSSKSSKSSSSKDKKKKDKKKDKEKDKEKKPSPLRMMFRS